MRGKIYLILFAACFLSAKLFGQAADQFETISFTGKDGIKISADIYPNEDKSTPVFLLFHQYRSSRGEYRDIAPILNDMGFNAIAFDTRAGGTDRWNNVENLTSINNEDIPIDYYPEVYPDLEAALQYVIDEGYTGKIIVWGSSFSATLVLKLAGDHPDKISAILSFSPGEYVRSNNKVVSEWASKVKEIPVFVTCGAQEQDKAKPIYDAIPGDLKRFYLPNNGNHGSSILIDDARNWQPVKEFISKVVLE